VTVVGDALLQAGADDAVASTLKDVSAKSLYDRILRNNGQVPTTIKDKQEKRRAHLVLCFYESMCTVDERKDLRSATMDAGRREVLLQHIDHLVLARLAMAEFRNRPEDKKKPPPGLVKQFENKSDMTAGNMYVYINMHVYLNINTYIHVNRCNYACTCQ